MFSGLELEAFFAPFADALGLRHGFSDSMQLMLLATARWVPLVTLAPFVGGRLVPAPVRMALALLFSMLVLPSLSAEAPVPLAIPTGQWWALVIKETFVGTLLGFAAALVFWGGEMGGRLIDLVRGTTTANLMIPQTATMSSILGDFYFQLFIVLYLISGAHRLFFSAAADFYRLLPPLELGLRLDAVAGSFILGTAQLFVIAVKIIAPALVVVMFLDMVLGVANRMAPQLNVHFLGISLKASLASLMIALSLYYILPVVGQLFRDQAVFIRRLVLDLPS